MFSCCFSAPEEEAFSSIGFPARGRGWRNPDDPPPEDPDVIPFYDEPSHDKDDAGDEEDFDVDDTGKFCDRTFRPVNRSIGGVLGDDLEFVIPGWGRPSQMLGANRTSKHELYISQTGVEPCLFGHTTPMDVHQGGLNDCWLISAMSAIAEYPFLVRRLFKQQTLAEDGRYDIRLYDRTVDKWVVITIDDRLPVVCHPGKWTKMLFCKPTDDGEFWPCLLEKAFAKLLSGYFRLDAGFIAVALEALTGKPSIKLPLNRGCVAGPAQFYLYGHTYSEARAYCVVMRNPGFDRGYQVWSDDATENVAVKMRLSEADEEDPGRMDEDEFFNKLKEWDEKGYLMGATAKHSEQSGILAGHRYTVLRLVEAEEEDGECMRMILVRNPHGGNEWEGPFSDNDEDSWNAHPATMEACEHTLGEKEDGQFWMTISDFVGHYDSVAINFQACVDQDGAPMLRYDEVEEGHEFTDFELDVEGHNWNDDDEVEAVRPTPDVIEEVPPDDKEEAEDDAADTYVDGLYVDEEFDACNESIGGAKGDDANPEEQAKMMKKLKHVVEGWARPRQFLGSSRSTTLEIPLAIELEKKGLEPCLFGHTSPHDMHQGGLGDCWLISAMSAIAEYPFLVHRLFKQQTLAEDGRYDIRLYDRTVDEWVVITIDDRLPLSVQPGKWASLLMASPTPDGEVWPCLLEKAFAKMVGAYAHLDGGFTKIALEALTGKPSILLPLGEGAHGPAQFYVYGKDYSSAEPAAVATRRVGEPEGYNCYDGPSSLPSSKLEEAGQELLEEEFDDDKLFDKLKEWDEKGYIMGASASENNHGILGGHAYTVLRLVEAEEEDGECMRMILVRNPHGGNEWEGPFSDNDEDSWNAHPATMEACEHTLGEKEDGQFWMTFSDFTKYFSSFCINFQACVDQNGAPMLRYDEVEEGHEFTDFELDVEGHDWNDEPRRRRRWGRK